MTSFYECVSFAEQAVPGFYADFRILVWMCGDYSGDTHWGEVQKGFDAQWIALKINSFHNITVTVTGITS